MTGELTVFTSDKALSRIYYIKWRIVDPDSNSETSFVEVTIHLKIISICTTNMIFAEKRVAAQTYYLGNPDLPVQLTFSALFAESICPLKFSYSVMNSLDITSFTNFNPVNGKLTVSTFDPTFVGVYLVIFRVEDT